MSYLWIDDSEKKPSQIPIAVARNTPATSTSIRESVTVYDHIRPYTAIV